MGAKNEGSSRRTLGLSSRHQPQDWCLQAGRKEYQRSIKEETQRDIIAQSIVGEKIKKDSLAHLETIAFWYKNQKYGIRVKQLYLNDWSSLK